ncbi:hypothetical protein PENSPDRAFT_672333 [Peniophora sp. CONT]|nr:hypothetical protein PENSPDRAFT_672333 [Peniophora sp. CONT]
MTGYDLPANVGVHIIVTEQSRSKIGRARVPTLSIARFYLEGLGYDRLSISMGVTSNCRMVLGVFKRNTTFSSFCKRIASELCNFVWTIPRVIKPTTTESSWRSRKLLWRLHDSNLHLLFYTSVLSVRLGRDMPTNPVFYELLDQIINSMPLTSSQDAEPCTSVPHKPSHGSFSSSDPDLPVDPRSCIAETGGTGTSSSAIPFSLKPSITVASAMVNTVVKEDVDTHGKLLVIRSMQQELMRHCESTIE